MVTCGMCRNAVDKVNENGNCSRCEDAPVAVVVKPQLKAVKSAPRKRKPNLKPNLKS